MPNNLNAKNSNSITLRIANHTSYALTLYINEDTRNTESGAIDWSLYTGSGLGSQQILPSKIHTYRHLKYSEYIGKGMHSNKTP